jgi:hypothetical protein
MILLEGPDGSGKTNLSKHLHERLGIQVAPRFATSEGGPVDELYMKMHADLRTWDTSYEPRIYDRHPLISELIYGPLVRGEMKPGFAHPSTTQLRKRVAYRSLVILALPPFDTVRRNVANEEFPQMPGVQRNIRAIWSMYELLLHDWPGWIVRYDYAAEEDEKCSREAVTRAARLHVAEWRRAHSVKQLR